MKPISLSFANNQDTMVVAHLNGSISIYDSSPLRSLVSFPNYLVAFFHRTDSINQAHTGSLNSIHTFTHSSEPVRDLQSNPAEKPEVIAVLRGSLASGTRVEMLNVSSTPSVVSTWDIRNPSQAQTCSKHALSALSLLIDLNYPLVFKWRGHRRASRLLLATLLVP